MYDRDLIKIYEQYREIRKEAFGPAPTAVGAPQEPDGATLGSDIVPDVNPSPEVPPSGDSIEITSIQAQPMGSPFEQLVSQVLQELERANNLTPQEVENVRTTLQKAKFDA